MCAWVFLRLLRLFPRPPHIKGLHNHSTESKLGSLVGFDGWMNVRVGLTAQVELNEVFEDKAGRTDRRDGSRFQVGWLFRTKADACVWSDLALAAGCFWDEAIAFMHFFLIIQ